MNAVIIQKLSDLTELYKKDPEKKFKFKVAAINKALASIKQYKYTITSGQYATENLPHIGEGIAKRIDEILETGTLSELPTSTSPITVSKEEKALAELLEITGMGEVRAKALIKNENIMSVDDYRKAIGEGRVKTTHHIDIGLKYFDDLKERIPRKEIELMEIIIRRTFDSISRNIIFNICGSYRRGKETCGDIDVLFTLKDNTNDKLLQLVVEKMTKSGYLIDHLTTKGDKKYMGICKGNRRIDIRYIEYTAYYAALLYFTGSKDFNIQIRNKAIDAGYSLSEYGLKDKKSGELIELHSEEELFNLLKIPYVKPVERDI